MVPPHEFLGKNLHPIKVSTQLSPAPKVRSCYICLMFIDYRSIVKSNRNFKEKVLHVFSFKQQIRLCLYGQFKLEYEIDFISSIITVTLKKSSELKVEAAVRRKVPF